MCTDRNRVLTVAILNDPGALHRHTRVSARAHAYLYESAIPNQGRGTQLPVGIDRPETRSNVDTAVRWRQVPYTGPIDIADTGHQTQASGNRKDPVRHHVPSLVPTREPTALYMLIERVMRCDRKQEPHVSDRRTGV